MINNSENYLFVLEAVATEDTTPSMDTPAALPDKRMLEFSLCDQPSLSICVWMTVVTETLYHTSLAL